MTWTKEGGNTKSIVKLEMQIIANPNAFPSLLDRY